MCNAAVTDGLCTVADVLKPPSSLLLTALRRLFWCNSYFMLFGVAVLCRILYSIVSYLYVSCSGSSISVGEERSNLSAIVYFLFEELSSSFWCLGWAVLVYCCTPWDFLWLFFTA